MRHSNKRGQGRGIKLILEHESYDGEGCLIWPMSCDRQGYGTFGYNGEIQRASRFMCELVNGPPPSPIHHAAHSCGKGHDGCYHPKHLSWKTPEENQADSVTHGTAGKAGRPRQKLTDEQVVQIRALRGKKTQAELGAMFGVRFETIGQIQRGKFRKGPWKPNNRRFTPAERAAKVATAKHLRTTGLTFEQVATQIDVSRLTARAMVRE